MVKPGKDPGLCEVDFSSLSYSMSCLHAAVLDLVCLNELKLISTVFSLKATTPQLTTSWIENIKQAQVYTFQRIL